MLNKVKQALLAMQRYSWEQGVAAQAFLEDGDEDTAVLLAVEAAHRQIADGRCAQMGAPCAVTDPCAVGEALIFACGQTDDPFLCAARDRLLRWALTDAPRSAAGVVYHMDNAPDFWVDSFYMLPPFLAAAGYYDEALRQLDGYWQALFLPEKELLAHRWSDGAQAFIRRDAWGVGNGWAAAGMARVIRLLPDSYADAKATLINRVRTLLDAALPLMREDGRFHDVLDDPCTFPEIHAGQMLAYTVFRGVKAHWLPERYLAPAKIIRAAAHQLTDRYGLVQSVCGAPRFDSPGVAPEGQAFFILMEAAFRDLNRA